jgi:pyruvate,water dikinase
VRDFQALVALAREEDAVRRLLSRLNGDARPLLDAVRGTAFGEAFQRFLRKHGWRAVYESDSAVPRYAEDPLPLLRSVQAAAPAPRAAGRQMESDAQAWSEARSRLPAWERLIPIRMLAARVILGRLRRLYGLRQGIRLALARWIAAERRWELELGDRCARRGWLEQASDYFYLRIEDAERAVSDPRFGDSGDLRRRVEQNRAIQQEWAAVPMPLVWVEGAGDRAAEDAPTPADVGQAIRGVPVSPGLVEGEVAILKNPDDGDGLRPGAILVAPVAGPAWAPFYAAARGLIVEVGGMLSHGSILAREYGLPAVANVAGATRLLRDGERVRVDANRGIIWRLDSGGAPESEAEAA